jgi:hypothetical protein
VSTATVSISERLPKAPFEYATATAALVNGPDTAISAHSLAWDLCGGFFSVSSSDFSVRCKAGFFLRSRGRERSASLAF